MNLKGYMSTILTMTRGTEKLLQCFNLNLPVYLIAYTRIPWEKYIKTYGKHQEWTKCKTNLTYFTYQL